MLAELALVSKGKSVQSDEMDEVLQALADLPLPPPSIRRLQIWSHPLTFAIVVILLGTFWVWRKAIGLI